MSSIMGCGSVRSRRCMGCQLHAAQSATKPLVDFLFLNPRSPFCCLAAELLSLASISTASCHPVGTSSLALVQTTCQGVCFQEWLLKSQCMLRQHQAILLSLIGLMQICSYTWMATARSDNSCACCGRFQSALSRPCVISC